MRRLILLIAMAVLCSAAVTSSAQAVTKSDWKMALERAMSQYADVFWFPNAAEGMAVSHRVPGFDSSTKKWGVAAQMQCCYVLALYGQIPCDGYDWTRPGCHLLPAVKDFLRPWLNGPIPEEQLRLLYHPPILDLRQPDNFGR